MPSDKQLRNVIFNAILENPKELRKRGFPLPSDGLLYKEVKIGDCGEIDLLTIARCELNDQLNIRFYEIIESPVGIQYLKKMLDRLEAISDWIGQFSDEEYYYVHGVLLTPKIDDFFSLYITKNISFYTIQNDPLEGITFEHKCFTSYDTHASCNIEDILLPPQKLRKNANTK